MPIYEYRCDNCGHEFESIQKVSDAPLKTCPACAQESLRKKVSAAGFRLKGAGWYETDFKSGNKRNVSGTADGGDTKSDTGSDSKNGSSAGKEKAGSGSDGAAAKSTGGEGSAGSSKAKASD
jgi:putative FmdB family regulatory protein